VATRLQSTRADQVASEWIDWLWRDWLAFGKLAVLEGDPGLGKSTLTIDLAARLSRGDVMPGEAEGMPRSPGAVLIISAEDSVSQTIRPRLEAAGADLGRLRIVTGVVDGELERPLSLPDDVPLLEAQIRAEGIRLLLVDPLMAFLGRDARGCAIDAHKDQSIRRLLSELTRLADHTGTAVLLVRHLNKAQSGRALYRGGGSIGITGAARSVLVVGAHPHDPQQRVLAMTKCNLGRQPASRVFTLKEATTTAGPMSRLEWLGVADFTSDDVVRPEAIGSETSMHRAVDRAKDYLLEALADGPVPQKTLYEEAKARGLSLSSLERAKKEVLAYSIKKGRSGAWHWRLAEPGELPPLM